MIGSSRKQRVFAHASAVDMRKSYNGLCALVRDAFKKDLLEGDVFLFVGKSGKRAKALLWDGTGVCIYQKRLEAGRFARFDAGRIELTMSELSLFFEGSQEIGRKSLSPRAFGLEQDGQVMFASSRREHPTRA
jgi:transposase